MLSSGAMEVSPDTLVREVVLHVPGGVAAMEKHHIDYCCGGAKTLRQVATELGLRVEWVLDTIAREREGGEVPDAQLLEVPLPQLVAQLVDGHHATSRAAAEALRTLVKTAVEAHPDRPELAALGGHVETLFAALLPHLVHEERNLFPYVRDLDRAAATPGAPMPVALFETIHHVLDDMEHEHERCDLELQAMRALTHDYAMNDATPPEVRALYEALDAHEKDLIRHMHLEGNVVFPRAARLEVKVRSQAPRATRR
jgi:regulator of cell morphogenesis and NO signaling